MWGILIALLVGIAYGYLASGKQDKSRLFWMGAIFALIFAAIITVIGWFTGNNPLTAGDVGFLGLVWSFIVSLVVFLAGVWVGDMIEGRRHRRALPPTSRRI